MPRNDGGRKNRSSERTLEEIRHRHGDRTVEVLKEALRAVDGGLESDMYGSGAVPDPPGDADDMSVCRSRSGKRSNGWRTSFGHGRRRHP